MKTALITGASAGFGKATAKLLSQKDYRLILVARRKDKLDKLAEELDCPVHTAEVDVRDKEQVQKLFSELPKEFADLDVVINNAGLALGLGLAADADIEDWETMVETNIKGLLYFTRQALEIFKKKNSGHIVNIGSVSGIAPYPGGNVYGATKAFVKQFSNNLRADLFGTDIRVTNIEPGAAETEFSDVRFKGDTEKAKAVYKDMRALKAEDIAEAVEWALSRPLHVNIDSLVIMPIDQTYAGLRAYRGE